MRTTLPVKENACYSKINNQILSFDLAKSIKNERKLVEFIDEIKIIRTINKWSTWGRIYFEIPMHVLEVFGIHSNNTLTLYINFVYNVHFTFAYAGEIFSGDAAWFDEYYEVPKEELFKDEKYSWNYFASILENDQQMEFKKYFNSTFEKWNTVPIQNFEAAIIAQQNNKHLAP